MPLKAPNPLTYLYPVCNIHILLQCSVAPCVIAFNIHNSLFHLNQLYVLLVAVLQMLTVEANTIEIFNNNVAERTILITHMLYASPFVKVLH